MVWKPHSETKSKFVFAWYYMVKVYVLAAEDGGKNLDCMEIKIKGSEITCFDLRGALNPARIELFIGDRAGKCFYYEKGWFLESK